jgi:MSHA biogenesis protein MshN
MDVFTMSLINKVLINIDKHQEAAEKIKPQATYNGISTVARSGYGQMIPLALGILVAGVAAGAFLWIQYHKPNTKLPQPIAQAVPVLDSKTTEASAKAPQPIAPEKELAVQVSVPNTPAVKLPAPVDSAKVSEAPVVTDVASSDVAKPPKQDKQPKLPTGKDAPMKIWSPEQRSDNLYRLAQLSLQQSKTIEAQQSLKQALEVNAANHSARQLLAELMIDAGHNSEAKVLLQDGLALSHGRSDFTMPLARLQVAEGNKDQAVSTLDQGLASAGDDAEYHAFLAALLQEQGHHDEAIKHYITALRTNSSMPSALIGVGVSLRAQNKMSDAAEAFQRAIDTGELTPEVAQFAAQQLKQIRQ